MTNVDRIRAMIIQKAIERRESEIAAMKEDVRRSALRGKVTVLDAARQAECEAELRGYRAAAEDILGALAATGAA